MARETGSGGVRLRSVWCVQAILLLGCGVAQAGLRATSLRCEYLGNPQGIDVVRPRLSWKLQSTTPSARGERQTAYQIQVALTDAGLRGGKPDLWDTGKIASDQSVLVEYTGRPLRSRMRCWWRVRVWGQDGAASQWSQPATWSMGLLTPEDWTAKWIGLDGGEEIRPAWKEAQWIWVSNAAARDACFRRSFSLPDVAEVRKAQWELVAAGDFTAFVNGHTVGGGRGGIQSENVAHIDVKEYLHAGQNIIAVSALGGDKQLSALIGEVQIELTEGNRITVSTDGKWRAKDTRPAGWEAVAFADQNWAAARALGPYGAAPWPRVVDDDRRLAARMLRREFTVATKVRRATAYVCGLGFFEFHLNGQKVGDHVMDPALSRYDKRAMYVTFDVTDLLKPGANAVGVILGNGRFFAPRVYVPAFTKTFGYPKLRLQMEIEYENGNSETVASDESWRLTTNGPIRANNEFDGEEYDAKREQEGWSAPGFDDSQWQTAHLVEAPGGALLAQMLEPMRVTEILKPVAITNPKPGMYLVDLGQNFYGIVRLKVRGPTGTRVEMRTAFTKRPDGTINMENNRSARSRDVYILKGKGEETWAPRFRGQGMRYVEITGFPGVPTAANIEGLVVHTDLEQAGDFSSSNALLNRIYSNVRWSIRMQERSVPLDPDRDERQAWLGTSIKSSESEAYLFNVAPFYTNFMGEIRVDQRADDNISDAGSIWPFYTGDPIWPSVITIVPEWFYNFYGDRRILEENYETMKRWMEFQERTNLGPDFTMARGFYGDWVDASSMDHPGGENGSTSRPLMWTAFFYQNCRVVARIARLLGKTEDQRYFEDLVQQVGAAFHRRFFNPRTGKYESETQCSYVLPLAFGLVPEQDRAAVVKNLVEDVMVKYNGHLTVGFVGMQYLMQTLTEIGHPEVAYTIAIQTTRPSWGYMISKGATSIWERWDTDTQSPGMNGESQCILSGNLAAWFFQTLAGINWDPERPGFKHIVLRPRPIGDLRFVKAWHESLYGRIGSQWRIESGTFRWNVTVPANTTATVYVPGEASKVTESGKPAAESRGVRFIRQEQGAAVYEVGSGTYSFASASKPPA